MVVPQVQGIASLSAGGSIVVQPMASCGTTTALAQIGGTTMHLSRHMAIRAAALRDLIVERERERERWTRTTFVQQNRKQMFFDEVSGTKEALFGTSFVVTERKKLGGCKYR